VKILLDSCVWGGVRAALEGVGHDVVWVGDWREDPGDEEILSRARVEGRTLITIDKDFGEIAIVRGAPHCGILRLSSLSVGQQAETCLRVLDRHGWVLAAGAIVTADPGRVRIRPRD